MLSFRTRHCSNNDAWRALEHTKKDDCGSYRNQISMLANGRKSWPLFKFALHVWLQSSTKSNFGYSLRGADLSCQMLVSIHMKCLRHKSSTWQPRHWRRAESPGLDRFLYSSICKSWGHPRHAVNWWVIFKWAMGKFCLWGSASTFCCYTYRAWTKTSQKSSDCSSHPVSTLITAILSLAFGPYLS